MKVTLLATWGLCFCMLASLALAAVPVADQSRARKGIQKLQREYNKWIRDTIKHPNSKCKKSNIVRRQEWGSLSKTSRRSYISAVQCLQRLPSQSAESDVPGARSRYDDFAATHISLTPFIHFDGLFLHFHRHLVWLYEKTLREECGYRGAQPYWDWTISWEDPSKSPVFDGSPYSMGSNGLAIPHGPTNISAFGLFLTIPPGTGGGCVHSGPFQPSEYNITLGPVAFEPKGPDNGLGYNPRCLSRDLSPHYSAKMRPSDVLAVISNCTDIACFDNQLEALDGVHASGHFSMGGVGIDAYAASGDPVFWLHHAQVDRVWSIWQSLDPSARLPQTWGTGTALNNPPSPNVTLDTIMNFGILGAGKKLGAIKSTVKGEYCYEYI